MLPQDSAAKFIKVNQKIMETSYKKQYKRLQKRATKGIKKLRFRKSLPLF